MNIKILFLNSSKDNDELTIINIGNNKIIIKMYVYNIKTYNLVKEIKKINDLINIYNNIKNITIIFDNELEIFLINKIITKISNILYSYKPTKEIKMYKYSLTNNVISYIDNESLNLMNELKLYKDIVMDPNKTPETYLEYIKSRVPSNYNIEVNNLKEFNKFPLTKAVGAGSTYNTYFVHIKPKVEDNNKKTIDKLLEILLNFQDD